MQYLKRRKTLIHRNLHSHIFLPHAKVHHHLLARSVHFVLENSSGNHFIAALKAYLNAVDRAAIKKVLIAILDTKNDQEDLFDWAVLSKPQLNDAFFSFQSQWTLSYNHINDAIKHIMRTISLSENSVSRCNTHSLGIGGASALLSQHVPDYIIQRLGRWKSLAFLEYICLFIQAF